MRSIQAPARFAPGRDDRLPRPHGSDDARRRAGHQSLPDLAGAVGAEPAAQVRSRHRERQVPGTPWDLRRPARRRRAPGRGSRAPRRRSSRGPATSRSPRPAFEDTELFERGVGRSTDIVRKEMFTFEDKGGRSITLRPEGTAPICRAYLEHGMQKLAQPVKLFYLGPFFRHERPQAGRYRQFHQLGVEAIGTDSPLADAEVIALLSRAAGRAGRAGGRAAARQPRLARGAPRLPGGAESSPARPRGRAVQGRARADRRQPAAGLRLRRRGDARRDGRGADDRRAARRRGRRALRRGARPARGGRRSPTRSTRPWSAASTTTRGRSSPSSARASAPSRRSAAAAATTA